MLNIQKIRNKLFRIVVLGVVLIFLKTMSMSSRVVLNVTNSLNDTFYIEVNKEIKKNDIVYFCPNYIPDVLNVYIPQGECDTGFMPFLKIVYAIEGDTVKVTDRGVFINNKLINNTARVNQYAEYYNTSHTEYRLSTNEYFVLTIQNPLSFDSRYYGVINKDNIIKVVKPLRSLLPLL